MACPICGGTEISLGTVPFDRNNAGVPMVNVTPMEYHQCTKCYFLYCPEMLGWTPEDLGNKVYNEEYVNYDPDYTGLRPRNYADYFSASIHASRASKFRHLDYGSGGGIMSDELNKRGWNSAPYDPYSHREPPVGKFKLITAIEVFEHSLNVDGTIKDILQYLDSGGVIIFSTQLADADTKIDWWYIGARNGHISILSKESMKILAIRNGLYFSSLNPGIHVLQRNRRDAHTLLNLDHYGR